MIFYAGDMVLASAREVFTGPKNSVFICRDIRSPLDAFYTLLTVKDKETAKKLVAVFENGRPPAAAAEERPYIACFGQNTLLCYVFAYHEERRLDLFAPGQIISMRDWETMSVNLLLACLSSPLPFPLLALALEQGHIHLRKDGTVFFTPYFDLTDLKEDSGEAVCARLCAERLVALQPRRGRAKSAELMRKKLAHNSLRGLPELYRDIKITEIRRKSGLKAKAAGFWRHGQDRLFTTVLVVSAALAGFALIVFVSQLLFGEIPIFRLFERCFDLIGERSLR
ncbi:MAG: hypothetical protein LBH21_00465 [Gracilibacteraceae bacterium]|jgi:hypothetical protein|nr:hypothetical protein [Gracilibacteraceae bacterium]